jgi:hypothetical protein
MCGVTFVGLVLKLSRLKILINSLGYKMFDISNLNEAELLSLNKAIISRLRALQGATAIVAAAKFHIGQLVSFRSGKGMFAPLITAKIMTINAKSITVTDVATNKGWRVAPQFLSPVETQKAA